MSSMTSLVQRPSSPFAQVILRTQNEFGFETADLVNPPVRLQPAGPATPALVETAVDIRRLTILPGPSSLLRGLTDGDNWSAQTKRSLLKILGFFLVGEDPQRRLDAREVSTLSHQVSLVRHVLDTESLRRVLIADEVGLGKTVEVGLILQELLERSPQLRILYLAPARLVSNVRREFERMRLGFRQWSSSDADARLTDNRIIASIHRAVHGRHYKSIVETPPWDVIVVDECHHLSDWAQGGGDPREKFKLVRDLVQRQTSGGRVLLLSGTPHQGHRSRFENLVDLLRAKSEKTEDLSGRVIYRTKDDVRDWEGNLLFPRRHVKEPIVVDLGPEYRAWITHIHDFFRPTGFDSDNQSGRKRAAGWRCAQALQWAASSPQAGVGYLVRQAIRAGWSLDDTVLRASVSALRPYRGGSSDESVDSVFGRMQREVGMLDSEVVDFDDIDEEFGDAFQSENEELQELLSEGLQILRKSADAKWEIIKSRLLDEAGDDKVVLFAQPIETVTAFAQYLERVSGERPALIIGGQSDAEREEQVQAFLKPNGPRFLVSSRAGGEGINLQVARRLVHIDVPWNPMDMEQRVGRVHRFGSRRTIIVDTLVVKDSREEHAYRVAREKLRAITATMVESERFEQVFSRVMSLVPPEELINVLSNSPLAPLTAGDQEAIAKVVREGFSAWQDFDRRFAESQRRIQAQDPGLATWSDVAEFLVTAGKWQEASGFVKQKFQWVEGEITSTEEVARVLQSPKGHYFACGDQGGIPIYGPHDERTEQLGLNLPEVRDLLHEACFPTMATGCFYVRWLSDIPLSIQGQERFFVFAFLRQSVRTDQHSGWSEAGLSFHTFLSDLQREPIRLEGEESKQFVQSLLSSTPRIKSPAIEDSLEKLTQTADDLANGLRRPSDIELGNGMRHAVWPIAIGVVDFAK